MNRLLATSFAAILVASAAVRPAIAQSSGAVSPAYFSNLQWRCIGPFRAGRALAATGVPGQPDRFYFGAVDGGVWETTDAGRTWNPIFDGEPVGSIGAIAVAPSNTNVLYVGTGEADMRSDIASGNGVYASADGGKTWSHAGLTDTRQIGAIAIDPRNAAVAYVAALGHQYGPNDQRGIFKTVDGGTSWTKVLYKNADTGAVDVALDPRDPNVVYAALWQTRRPPWNVYPPSNGPGSGLFKSSDGGATWKALTVGLPAHTGRIGIAVSRSNPQRVYALVDASASEGGVYRSDDAGATWSRVDGESRIWQRGWYFGGVTADPKRPDVVYVMNTSAYRSTDGGRHFEAFRGSPGGDDYHTLSIDPNDSARMILAGDQGTIVTVNGGKTWSSWYNQPTGQFYHAVTDGGFPFRVYGAQQDSGAGVEPVRSRYASISNRDFQPVDVGGESGSIAPDPHRPNDVYGGSVTRERIDIGWERNLDPTLKYPAQIWRNTWTLPIVFSPADPSALYTSHQRIFRSRDRGKTWTVVSPDLSRANEGRPTNLDAPTLAENNGVDRHGVVYSIAPSPIEARTIWAGTDDGYVWITRDGGRHWNNVTPPALTAWSKVGTIAASRYDAKTAYIAVDRHRLDDDTPYAYRTRDGGRTWTAIARGIPEGSFVNAIREDPQRRGLLYAGTERGVYVSFDDGARWQSLQLNLPVTSIRDVAFGGSDVVLATHGRALWVLDDVAALRQATQAAAAGGDYLYAPPRTYRVRPGNDEGTPLPRDEAYAPNPPTGLYVDYVLADAPRTPVVVEIRSSNDRLVRRWSSAHPPKPVDPTTLTVVPSWIEPEAAVAAQRGAHRLVWDFHENDADGPLAPPGRYSIVLLVDGKTYRQEAALERDPRIPATDADLRAQYELATAVATVRSQVAADRVRAESVVRTLPADAARAARRQIVGEPAPENPDDSVGAYSHDFSSLLYLENSLDYLESAIESGDAAPTPDMRASFDQLQATYRKTLRRLNALKRR